MSSDRHPNQSVPTLRIDGRYLRWSHRYSAWQIRTREGTYINVSVPMARAYAAAGLPIGVQT